MLSGTRVSLLVAAIALTAWPTLGSSGAAHGTSGIQDAGSEALTPAAADVLLHRMGRNLARLLAQEEVREHLDAQLTASPFVEGRVRLRSFLLREDEPWQSLSGMQDGPKGQVRALPELELYFPLPEHRATWRSAGELLVAVPIADSRRFLLYDAAGGSREIAAETPPLGPTLLLGPSEIDYEDAPSARVGGTRTGEYLLRRGSKKHGTAPEPEARHSPAEFLTGASSYDTNQYTYLTQFRINEDFDGWLKGSMEIDVWGLVNNQFRRCARYTGISEDVLYPGLPKIPGNDADQIAFAVPLGSGVINVHVWEDDDGGGCNLDAGDDLVGDTAVVLSDYNDFLATSNGDAAIRLGSVTAPSCGDAACNGNETRSNCCVDCESCGDGVCNGSCGETMSTCGSDCTCGNGICEWNESWISCPADCDSCGNLVCDPGEDQWSCPSDCCDGGRVLCEEPM